MTDPRLALEPHERAAALALLQTLHSFEGTDPGADPLGALTEADRAALVLLVRRVLRAAGAEPPVPRPRGPLCEADAEALRLDLPGARAVVVLALDGRRHPVGVYSGAVMGAVMLSPAEAKAAWDALFALPEPASPHHPES